MPNPGMSPAVQQALQRRQQSTPMMDQTSPQAPMQDQAPQPMNPSEMTQAAAPSQAQGQPAQKQPKFEPQTQEDLIVQALIEQLKNNNKLKKEQAKMATGGGSPNQDFVSHKIPLLRQEGYPQDQAVAVAHSMAEDRNSGGGNPFTNYQAYESKY